MPAENKEVIFYKSPAGTEIAVVKGEPVTGIVENSLERIAKGRERVNRSVEVSGGTWMEYSPDEAKRRELRGIYFTTGIEYTADGETIVNGVNYHIGLDGRVAIKSIKRTQYDMFLWRLSDKNKLMEAEVLPSRWNTIKGTFFDLVDASVTTKPHPVLRYTEISYPEALAARREVFHVHELWGHSSLELKKGKGEHPSLIAGMTYFEENLRKGYLPIKGSFIEKPYG